MSYIRSLSNPEGLYVWSDGDRTCLTHNVKKPLSSGKKLNHEAEMVVPTVIFDYACKLWHEEGGEKRTFKGFRIEEHPVDTKTGKQPPKNWNPLDRRRWKNVDWRIRISYKKDFVYLWLVTWAYVVRHAIESEKFRRLDDAIKEAADSSLTDRSP